MLLTLASHWQIDYADLQMGDVIGEGSFGRVYRAKWRGSDVAVKQLISGVTSSSKQDELNKVRPMKVPGIFTVSRAVIMISIGHRMWN